MLEVLEHHGELRLWLTQKIALAKNSTLNEYVLRRVWVAAQKLLYVLIDFYIVI